MSDAWNWAGGAVNSIGGALGGNGSDAGILGQGQERFQNKAVDQSNFQSGAMSDQSSAIQDRQGQVDARGAPTAKDTQLGAMQNMSAAHVANASTVGNTQLGSASQVSGAGIGNANVGNASQMQAAAAGQTGINRQDTQFRDQQTQLANALQVQAAGGGPSLAGQQLRDATDRTLAQQVAAAASSRGGVNPALAARGLASNAATAQQQAGTQAAQMKMQEQLNAQGQLGNVTQSARAQDIGVNTSQAGLNQDVNLANANLSQAANQNNSQLGQQMTLANMNALNQRQSDQANMYQQANLSNQAANNQFALQQGSMNQQGNMFNASAVNSNNQLQANLYQQAFANNQNAQNAGTMQQGQMNEQTNMANLSAYLQNQGQNDNMSQFYQGLQNQINQQQMQGNENFAGLQSQQQLTQNQIDQSAYQSAAANHSSAIGGIASAIGGIAMMSDERQKTDVGDGSDFAKNFLSSFRGNNFKSAGAAASQKEGSGLGTLAMGIMKSAKGRTSKLAGTGGGTSFGASSSSAAGDSVGAGASSGASMADMGELTEMSDEEQKSTLGGGSQATQNFLRSLAGSDGSSNVNAANIPKMSSGTTSGGGDNLNPSPIYGAPKSIGGNSQNGGQGPFQFGGQNDWRSQHQPQQPISTPQQPAQSQGSSGGVSQGGLAGGIAMGSNAGGSTAAGIGASSGGVPAQSGGFTNTTVLAPTNLGVNRSLNTGNVQAGTNQGYAPVPVPVPISQQPIANQVLQSARPAAPQAMAMQAAPMQQVQAAPLAYRPMTSMFAMSDEEQKKGIEEDNKTRHFLDAIHAHKYRYKDPTLPGAGEGEFVSPMAQELEKSELGKSMVKDTPNGKMVDYGKGFGTILAAQAMLNERMKKLEKK